MSGGIRPVTVNVYAIGCQADGCKRSVTVRGTMAISALQEAERHGWSTSGKKNLCREHAGQREQSQPGRRTAAAAAAAKKK